MAAHRDQPVRLQGVCRGRRQLIAIPFAILGPIITGAGAVQVARGHIAVPRGPAWPLPIAIVFIGAGTLIVGQYWRRGGMFRSAARHGGWMRVSAIVASLGAVSFGVFTALGFTTLGIAGWLASGLASVPLLIARKSTPEPPRTAPHTPPPAQPAPTEPDVCDVQRDTTEESPG